MLLKDSELEPGAECLRSPERLSDGGISDNAFAMRILIS